MGGLKSTWRSAQLLASLGILFLRGIILSISNAFRGAFKNLLRRRNPLPHFDLMVSTYEAMRERLRESLKEIEQKNQTLEASQENLTRSRNFLQAVIDSLDEDLIVLDNNLRVVQANRSLSSKHSSGDIIGRHCYEVIHGASHPCNAPLSACPIAQVKKTGAAARVVQSYNSRKDASENRYLEVTISPIRDKQGNIVQFVELLRDVTKGKELESRVTEANRRLLTLNAIASTASQSLNLDVILNGALDEVLGLLEAEAGGVLLLDDKGELFHRVHRGLPEDSEQGLISLELAKRVAERGETMVENDLPASLSYPGGLKTFITIPLRMKDKVVGILTIASRKYLRFYQPQIQFLTSIGHQLGIAVENVQLYRQLQLKEESRTELLRRIISAQEAERQRVARELHDVTSQTLATLAVGLEALAKAPPVSGDEMHTKVGRIRSLISTTSEDIHRLIYDLRPSLLDDLGLSAALRSCAHSSLDAAGVEVTLEVAGQECKLPPEIQIALFRIAQEAIANIAKHAHAESAYINLEFRDKSVAIQIEDDGMGFDFTPGFSGRGGGGVGLLGMKERAELLGGTLSIDTRPGVGTKVSVEIPLNHEVGNV